MSELTRHKARLVLRTPFELKEVAAALPGAVWDRSARVWTYPATVGTAAVVHNAIAKRGGLATSDEVAGLLEWARRAVAARACRVATELPPVPSRTDAWQHQAQAFHWAVEQEAALLWLDMGTGKSKVAIDLINAWQASPVLILAGKRALSVWPKQFRIHSLADYHVTRGDVPSARGGVKKNPQPAERIEALERAFDIFERLAVLINYELAWREPFRSFVLGRQWPVVVLDEGHRVRAPGGKQSRFADALRDRALGIDGGRRLELTGTFLPHSPLDAYGQLRFLEPALLGTNFAKVKARYGKPRVLRMAHDVDSDGELIEVPVYMLGPDGKPLVDGVRDEVKGELADKFASVSFHVSADDALDLPRELDHVVEVELGPATSRIYRELERDFVAEVDGGVVTADNALSKLLRLQQITSGHLAVEKACEWCAGNGRDGYEPCTRCKGAGVTETVETVGEEKLEALTERLSDLPRMRIHPRTFEVTQAEPVVVFARFSHDLINVELAAQRADRGTYAELSGGRADALDADGVLAPGVDVAGVQIKSGSEGIDFTRARLACYLSLGFELMVYKQSRARTRRPGADLNHPVEYVHFVAVLDDGSTTVDGDTYAALARRESVVESVIARMRARVRGEA